MAMSQKKPGKGATRMSGSRAGSTRASRGGAARRPRADRTGWRRFIPSWRTVALLGIAYATVIFGGLIVAVAAVEVPQVKDIATAQTTIVFYADGETELTRLGEANRTSVRLDNIPEHARQAVLAAEDRGFYEHGGFSPVGIVRAFVNNLTSDSTQGASTITQQYAKNAFLSQERTLTRKARELILSIKLETQTDKDQILENYLNTIYFGRSTYGIETAAQAYFGVKAQELTVSQSAVLAAIIRSPGTYTPERHLPRLQERWGYVLDSMVQAGWLSAEERELQEFPEIRERVQEQRYAGPKGHLIETVRRELIRAGFTDQEIEIGGLRVTSTFEQKAQDALVTAVQEKGPQSGTEGLRIGIASIRPSTGEVVALYGGDDYLEDQLNNATQAIGQAGSTFKAFALAAALEQGIPLDSVWNGDSGVMVRNYKVNNYDQKSWGEVTLLEATEQSINSPYVAVTDFIGSGKVVEMAIRTGIPASTPALEPVLSVPLGTSSPKAIDIASAYATFAARGLRTDPVFIKEVRGRNGGVLFQMRAEPRRAIPERVADSVNFALQQVVRVGTGRSAAIGRPVAGKTGTTNENRSAWFVGYTPDLSTAIMMVKDDENGNPITLRGTGGRASVTGGSFPAAIFAQYMRAALADVEPRGFVKPVDVPTATPTPVESDTPTPVPTVTVTETQEPDTTASPISPTPGPTGAVPGTTSSPSPTGFAPGRERDDEDSGGDGSGGGSGGPGNGRSKDGQPPGQNR
jgi:membrane peptidoglycan carboxypeptidase